MNEKQLEELLHIERLQRFFQYGQWLELREENCRLRGRILELESLEHATISRRPTKPAAKRTDEHRVFSFMLDLPRNN
jgi:hypothetical protein